MLLTLLVSAAISVAADKPTIYNTVNGESTALDPLVKAALAPKFTIVDNCASSLPCLPGNA
jgi:hypothetical protein